MVEEHVDKIPSFDTWIRVLTSSMGWVKFTANIAAVPPRAVDWIRVGLFEADIEVCVVDPNYIVRASTVEEV